MIAFQAPVHKLQWVGPQVTRAKPLPQATWDEHKDEMRDLYDQMTLEDLMTYMREWRNFEATKRQFVFQFTKWGFQKYQKAAVTDNIRALQLKSSTEPLPLTTAVRIPGDSLKLFQSTSFAVKDHRSQHVRPTKRQKLSAPQCSKHETFEAAQQSNPKDLNAGKFTNGDSINGITTKSLPPIPIEAPPARSTIVTKNTTQSTVTQHFVDDEQQTEQRDGVELPSLPRVDKASIHPIALEPKSTDTTLALLRLDRRDTTDLVLNLTEDQLENVLVAADFLAFSKCPAEAFALYMLVLKRQQDKHDVPKRMVECALIGCARYSMCRSHMHIAQNMLNHHIENIGTGNLSELRRSVYDLLLEDVRARLDTTQELLCLTYVRGTVVWPQFSLLGWSDEEAQPLVLELAYHTNQNATSAHHVQYIDPIYKSLPWTHSAETLVISGIVRQFLDWCHFHLRCNNVLDAVMLQVHTQPHFAFYISLFHGMFKAYTKDVESLQSYSWATQAKTSLGLSSARFLATVSLMIFSQIPYAIITSGAHMQLFLLHESAASACRKLSGCDDGKLSYEFLHAYYYLSAGTMGSSEVESKTYEDHLRPFVRSQVEEILHVKLPSLPAFKIADKQGAMLNAAKYQPPLATVTMDETPTLAASLHSSDYHDLTELREQLRTIKPQTDSAGGRPTSYSKVSTGESRVVSEYLATSSDWSLSQYLPGSLNLASSEEIEGIAASFSRVSLDMAEQDAGEVLDFGHSVVWRRRKQREDSE